jgi:hypothetical protein
MTRQPRRFALVQDADDSRKTVGYGMVLPDGSTFCVPWPTRGNWFYSSDDPERIASLVDAEVEYIDDLSQPVSAARELKGARAVRMTFLEVADTPPGTTWRKSTFSGPNSDNCVETATVNSAVAVRHSKNPDRGALLFDQNEWAAFVRGVKAGEFDHQC